MDKLEEILSTFLRPYLTTQQAEGKPLTILTWAQSLDAKIATGSRQPMALSSVETKFMTHLIRRRTDVILIGAGTAVSDNPSLNGGYSLCLADGSEDTGWWVGGGVEGCRDERAAEAGYCGSTSTSSSSETIASCVKA